MRVTQKDIAKKLNLSQSTIAKVLNDRPDVWVSAETRRRIHVAALESGYRPNAAARALSTGKSNIVSLVFRRPEIAEGRMGFAEVIELLAEFLGERGYDLSVKALPDREQVLSCLDDLARSRACDAVVLWDDETEIESQALILEDLDVPFVVKGRFESSHPTWPQIDFDHERMMYNIVTHLAHLGHRRIALLAHDNTLAYTRYFREGFDRGAIELLGGVVDSALIGSVGSDRAHAEQQVLTWLNLPEQDRPTAIAVAAGKAAWEGIEQALARHGRRIGDGPGEIAVAGQCRQSLTLTFGHGYAYVGTDFFALASALAERLLWPMLCGTLDPAEQIVRVLPELQPTGSLEMGDHVVFRTSRD